MNASTAHNTRPVRTPIAMLPATSNSDTIHDVAIQASTTGPHNKSTTSTWNGSSQRKLTVKELSGKRGAHHGHRQPSSESPPHAPGAGNSSPTTSDSTA